MCCYLLPLFQVVSVFVTALFFLLVYPIVTHWWWWSWRHPLSLTFRRQRRQPSEGEAGMDGGEEQCSRGTTELRMRRKREKSVFLFSFSSLLFSPFSLLIIAYLSCIPFIELDLEVEIFLHTLFELFFRVLAKSFFVVGKR